MALEMSFIEIASNLGMNFLTLIAAIIGIFLVSKPLKLKHGKLVPFALILGVIVWFVLAVILGMNNFFIPHPTAWAIPNIIFIFLPIVIGLVLLFLEDFKKIVEAVPTHRIIGIQIYRILGIIFITLYLQGLLPGEFAIPTGIGDIIIGFTAPIIAFMYAKKKMFAKEIAIAWNLIGILDLVIALILGILTTQSAIQVLALNNPNKLVTAFPLVMVPAFAVPLSILLHIYSLKVLTKK